MIPDTIFSIPNFHVEFLSMAIFYRLLKKEHRMKFYSCNRLAVHFYSLIIVLHTYVFKKTQKRLFSLLNIINNLIVSKIEENIKHRAMNFKEKLF